MVKKRFILIGMFVFLICSCSNKTKINIEILKNQSILSLSSTEIVYKVDLPTEDNIDFVISCDIGHVNNQFSPNKVIVNENEETSWSCYPEEVKDNYGNYYQYGFIEGLIRQNKIEKGYFLIAIKNYEADPKNYDYRIEVLSTYFDKSSSLDEISSLIKNEKKDFIEKYK